MQENAGCLAAASVALTAMEHDYGPLLEAPPLPACEGSFDSHSTDGRGGGTLAAVDSCGIPVGGPAGGPRTENVDVGAGPAAEACGEEDASDGGGRRAAAMCEQLLAALPPTLDIANASEVWSALVDGSLSKPPPQALHCRVYACCCGSRTDGSQLNSPCSPVA